MIKKNVIVVFLLLSHNMLPFSFVSSYDRGADAAKKGKWVEAKKEYVRSLVDQPYNASLLHDLGVASYQTEDFDKADAYFKKAAEYAGDDSSLKEQAYFNRGNTLVKQKKLEQALEQYENTLAVNHDNEKALHNREIVKALLEQDKQHNNDDNQNGDSGQQGNQQQESGNNGDDSQDEQSGDDEHNEKDNQQGNSGDDKADKKDNQEGNEDQDSSNNDSSEDKNSEQENSQNEQGSDSPEDSKDDVEGEDGRDDGQDEQSQHDSNWDTDSDAQDSDEGQQSEQQNQAGHDQLSEEKDTASDRDQYGAQGQDTSDQGSLQEQEGTAAGGELTEDEPGLSLDDWAIKLLQERDNQDAALNKKMIKAAVGEKEIDASGKNCW